MKVILLKDVAKVGRKYDIKEVADGYAQNNLLPRKLAIAATAAAIARIEAERARQAGAQAQTESALREVANATKEHPLRIAARANEQGHLFEGVSAAMVADAIRTAHGLMLAAKDIDLAHPLKAVGQYQVPMRFGTARGECTIIIEAK